MRIFDFITNDFKPLSPTDTVNKARLVFDTYRYDYLPIVDNGLLVGCLPSDFNIGVETKELIGDYADVFELFYVHPDFSLIDTLKVLGINDSNIVMVVDEKRQYSGYVTQYDVMSRLSNTPFVNEIGGVIVVKKPIGEYSFSEIAQIVESENSKLLGIVVSDFIGEDAVLTIKINKLRLGSIEASLKRYGYTILESYHENRNIDDLQDRYNFLMSYLDV